MSTGTADGHQCMTSDTVPAAQLDARYSQQGATPTGWAEVRQVLRVEPTTVFAFREGEHSQTWFRTA